MGDENIWTGTDEMGRMYGVVLAVMGAVAFGTMPLLARVAYHSTGAVTVVFLRFFLAACILFAYFTAKGVKLKITRPQLAKGAFLGVVGYAGTGITLFSSFHYIDVGPAMAFHFVYPSLVAVLALVIYRERLSLLNVVGLIMSLIGIYFLLGGGQSRLNLIGVGLALASGLFFAITALELGRGQIKSIDNMVLTFYLCLFAALGTFCFGLITNDLHFQIDVYGWAALGILSLVCTVFAIAAFSMAVRIIGSTQTAILNTFEPVTSIVLGALILGEKMSGIMILGSGLIIAAAVIFCLPQKETGEGENELLEQEIRA